MKSLSSFIIIRWPQCPASWRRIANNSIVWIYRLMPLQVSRILFNNWALSVVLIISNLIIFRWPGILLKSSTDHKTKQFLSIRIPFLFSHFYAFSKTSTISIAMLTLLLLFLNGGWLFLLCDDFWLKCLLAGYHDLSRGFY